MKRSLLILLVLAGLALGSGQRAFCVTLAEALDGPGLAWVTAPSNAFTRPWFATNNVPFDGVDEAISGNYQLHNTDSWIETTVVGPGTISFYWRVSCELPDYFPELEFTNYYDYLEFKMAPGTPNWSEIEPLDIIAGVVGWTPRSFAVPPGTNTLRWNYHKDGGENGPVDRGRLDQVFYTADPVPPVAVNSFASGPKVGALNGFFLVSDSDGSVTNVYTLNQPAGFASTGTNWTYNPNGFAGTNVIPFYAVDNLGDLSSTQALTIITTNRRPQVVGQSLTNLAETPIPIALSGYDPDGDPLSFLIVNEPVHGVVSGEGSDWVYSSFANYYGADSFSFTASDGADESAPGIVGLTVLPVNREVLINGIGAVGEAVSISGWVQPNRQVVLEATGILSPAVWLGVHTQNITWSTNLSVPYDVSVPRTNASQFFRLKSLLP